MTDLTPDHLAHLADLAGKVTPGKRTYFAVRYMQHEVFLADEDHVEGGASIHCDYAAEAVLIAALDKETVEALVGQARRADELERLLMAYETALDRESTAMTRWHDLSFSIQQPNMKEFAAVNREVRQRRADALAALRCLRSRQVSEVREEPGKPVADE